MLKQNFYFSRFFLASSCDDIDYGGNYDGRTFEHSDNRER